MIKKILIVIMVVVLTMSLLVVSVSASDITVEDPGLSMDGEKINLNNYFKISIELSENELFGHSFDKSWDLFSDFDDICYVQYGDTVGMFTGARIAYENGVFNLYIKLKDNPDEFIINDISNKGELNFYLTRQPLDVMINETVWDYLPYSEAMVKGENNDSFFGVLNHITLWLTGIIASVAMIFYANGSLTFVGTLAIIGVGLLMVLLFVNIVRNYLQMRG